MAIIKCEECGKEISEKAVSCPYCGAPNGNTQKNNTKFCKHCGEIIDKDCVVCPKCGKQVEEFNNNSNEKNIIINNNNNNSASAVASTVATMGLKPKNKWISFLLCLFAGYLGAHKFYEGKLLLGVVYLVTCGCLGIGWLIDIFVLLFKPNPYYV